MVCPNLDVNSGLDFAVLLSDGALHLATGALHLAETLQRAYNLQLA